MILKKRQGNSTQYGITEKKLKKKNLCSQQHMKFKNVSGEAVNMQEIC